ncbi:MAG: hypothetical protein LKG27_02630 [Clostridiaceae bacterium]|jgi:hypothetical protein|nr:hypothetical protein [Clostridiaceae bacterium]
MPKINTKASMSTFQQCDGSNFSTAGVDCSINVGSGKLSTYAGMGSCFTKGSTGLIFDAKGSLPYGNSCFSGGFRVRNNINDKSKTVQFRIQPATVSVPVSKDIKLYATPYFASKLDYKTSKVTNNVGGFAGVSAKFGKTNVFVEGQIYDVSKIDKSTTSINAGVSIDL